MDKLNFYVSPSLLQEEDLEAKTLGVVSPMPHFRGRRYTHCCDATIENTVRPEDSILIGTGSSDDVSWPYGTGTAFDPISKQRSKFLPILNCWIYYDS